MYVYYCLWVGDLDSEVRYEPSIRSLSPSGAFNLIKTTYYIPLRIHYGRFYNIFPFKSCFYKHLLVAVDPMFHFWLDASIILAILCYFNLS